MSNQPIFDLATGMRLDDAAEMFKLADELMQKFQCPILVAQWFREPHALMGGKSPMQVLKDDQYQAVAIVRCGIQDAIAP